MSYCPWCSSSFEPRQNGGKPQRYCSPECRREMDHAARGYALAAVEAGILTVADLKRGAPATPALPQRASPSLPAPALVPDTSEA